MSITDHPGVFIYHIALAGFFAIAYFIYLRSCERDELISAGFLGWLSGISWLLWGLLLTYSVNDFWLSAIIKLPAAFVMLYIANKYCVHAEFVETETIKLAQEL